MVLSIALTWTTDRPSAGCVRVAQREVLVCEVLGDLAGQDLVIGCPSVGLGRQRVRSLSVGVASLWDIGCASIGRVAAMSNQDSSGSCGASHTTAQNRFTTKPLNPVNNHEHESAARREL